MLYKLMKGVRKMKRNCNACRASSKGFYGEYTCELGYKVDSNYSVKFSSYIEGKPLEECPKPKTYNEYMKYFNKDRN
jgi:hypothetical protein